MKLTHFEGENHHHSEAYDTGWHLAVEMKDGVVFQRLQIICYQF